MKSICIVGVKGIGKSSLLKEIETTFPNYICIYGSTLIQKIVGQEKFKVFDTLSETEKYNVRTEVIQFLTKNLEEPKLGYIVDGHVTLYDAKLRKPIPVFTEADCNFYTNLILLDSTIEQVYNQRVKDTKKRILEKDIIEEELIKERQEAKKLSIQYDMQLDVLLNSDFQSTKTVLIELIHKITN